MFHRFVSVGSSPLIAHVGEGTETRQVRQLLYIDGETDPANAGRGPAKTIDFADALRRAANNDGSNDAGLIVFLADGLRAGDTLRSRLDELRVEHPAWTMAWVDAAGRVGGIALTTGEQPPDGLSPTYQPWVGSVAGSETVQIADNLGVTFQEGAAAEVTLDADGELVLQIGDANDGGVNDASGAGAVRVDWLAVTGPITIDLFTDTPGQLRFAATNPAPLDADIRFRTGEGKIASATAFTAPSGQVSVNLNPANPFDAEQNRFDLPAELTLSTGWSTPSRQPIDLVTIDGSALAVQSAGDESAYLTPSGRYRCSAAGQWVCGLFGAEFVDTAAESTVAFVPGHTVDGPTSGSADELSTAWLSTPDVDYFGQSTSSGFYRSTDPSMLTSVPVSGATVPPGLAFPTMPWRTYDGAAEPAAALEHMLADRRRSLLLVPGSTPSSLSVGDGPSKTADGDVVTPSGLRATINGGGIISLGVVKVQDRAMTIDVTETPGLRAALCADDQCIVMSRRPTFRGQMGSEPTLPIDGWDLDFSKAHWQRSGTMIIIKQRTDRSVTDLVSDTESWTLPGLFNDNPQRTASRLEQWLTETRDDDDPAKQDLVRRVLDQPSWQGVLMLAVAAPLTGLPDELAMLAMGMTQTGGERGEATVLAHHLVVDRRPVNPSDGGSAVSGLLEYRAPGNASARGPETGLHVDGNAFTVASLRVRFTNSEVSEFGAAVDTTLGSVLGAPLTTSSLITLHGRQQKRAGATHYSFGTDLSATLQVDDATLESVTVDRADLVAVADGARLSFDGTIGFVEPADGSPDLIGYRQLTYRSLDLSVRDGTGPGRRGFTWSATRAEVSGTPEPGSLPGSFPLRPVGLIVGQSSEIKGLGFQPVRLPNTVDAEDLSERVIGIDQELDLGSLGGLASVSGFVANMAVFWSADRNARRLQLGLRFPGFDVGAHGFSLQDIFGITSHGLVLDHIDGEFQLRINGLAISLLGFEIPWGGTVNVDLNTDPRATSPSPLGWYGRYTKAPEADEHPALSTSTATTGTGTTTATAHKENDH